MSALSLINTKHWTSHERLLQAQEPSIIRDQTSVDASSEHTEVFLSNYEITRCDFRNNRNIV